MSQRIFKYTEQIKAWCHHIGGRYNERPESIEVYLPEDNAVLHISPDEAYIHGFNNTETTSKHYTIRTSGVQNGKPDHTTKKLTDPKKIVLTLDEQFGTIEIFNCRSPIHQNGGLLRIETIFNGTNEENIVTHNWKDMTPLERGKMLNEIPDTHHKEIVIRELEAANFEIKYP